MAIQVNIHEAKTHLSRLIQRVLGGEEVIIARAGKPAVKLMAVQGAIDRRPGTAKGQVEMAPDFDAPLPPEILTHFEQ